MHRGCCGNCAFWWRENGSGYTCNLGDAWLVSKEKAGEICRDRPAEDFPVPEVVAIQASQRHVDVNLLWQKGFGKSKKGR